MWPMVVAVVCYWLNAFSVSKTSLTHVDTLSSYSGLDNAGGFFTKICFSVFKIFHLHGRI